MDSYKAILFGDHRKNNFDAIGIKTEIFTIGSDASCNCQLKTIDIRPFHVKMVCKDGRWTISTCDDSIDNVTVDGKPITGAGVRLREGSNLVFNNRLSFIFEQRYLDYITLLKCAWTRMSKQFFPELCLMGPYEAELSNVHQAIACGTHDATFGRMLRCLVQAKSFAHMLSLLNCAMCKGFMTPVFRLPCGKLVGLNCAADCYRRGRCLHCQRAVNDIPEFLDELTLFNKGFYERNVHLIKHLLKKEDYTATVPLAGKLALLKLLKSKQPRARSNSF